MTTQEPPEPRFEVLSELLAPPPRPANSRLVASAVRAYRLTYLGLGLLVFPFFSSGEGARAAWRFLAPVLAVAFAAYIESSVRVVRRLARAGEVRHATVTRVSPVDARLIWLALDDTQSAATINAHVHDHGLAVGDRVPVLVAKGTSLVGLIVAEGEIEVARVRTRWVTNGTRPSGRTDR